MPILPVDPPRAPHGLPADSPRSPAEQASGRLCRTMRGAEPEVGQVHQRVVAGVRSVRSFGMLTRILFATCLATVTACTQSSHDAAPANAGQHPDLAQAASPEPRLFADSASGVRFRVQQELATSVEHFDPSLPPHKMRHSITLSALGTNVARVDVWDNPEGLSLQAWFDRHMAFTVVDGATMTHRLVGARRTDAIEVDQPVSPQSPPRRLTVVASGSRVACITCFDLAEPRQRAVCDQVASDFELEVAR